jgi:hypothetical protein
MSEFRIAVREKHHLDTVGVEALVVDQPSRKHLRLRWIVRLDVDQALKALEAMAVGIAEILVEGDAIGVHLALHPSGMAPHVTPGASCRPASSAFRHTI